MDYSKYYTPLEIAERLINEIKMDTPAQVIDICCGSCNLLKAAKKRWNTATCFGVDINPLNSDCIDYFFQIDGREYALANRCKFDLVLANPPFGYSNDKKFFPDLYSEYKSVNTSRMEIEMLIANTMLLAPGGILLIILPSSFVEAESYSEMRRIVASKYHIDCIIKLDKRTFGSALINCYALIIRNSKSRKITHFYDYSLLSQQKSNKRVVPATDLTEGFWVTRTQLGVIDDWNIKRGNISSSDLIKRGQPVLHTSKNSDNWSPRLRYVSNKLRPSVFVEDGDILVSRIGKSAGAWCVYHGEKMPITDCLFRIKDINGAIAKKIHGRTYSGNTKGVTTQYITYADFCDWINSN